MIKQINELVWGYDSAFGGKKNWIFSFYCYWVCDVCVCATKMDIPSYIFVNIKKSYDVFLP